MATHFYVQQEYLSGTASGSILSDVSQMQHNNKYAISRPLQVIAKDIFSRIEDQIDARYTETIIYNQLLSDGHYGLKSYDSDELSIILSADIQRGEYYYDDLSLISDEMMFRRVYRVKELDDDDTCYIVVDKITKADTGAVIEKCYHPYFTELDKLDDYLHSILSEYDSNGVSDSRIYVLVKSIRELSCSEWYRRNVSIADKIAKYELDAAEFRYLSDFDYMDELIKARAYDVLPVDERIAINMDVYRNVLYKYVPIEISCELDYDMDFAEQDVDAIENVVNTALAAALINAETPAIFKKIHDDMGVYDYWISGLTDSIYRAHPNKGYILVSSSGMLKWYDDRDAFSLGKWAGAKDKDDNPYYGKFQANSANTLLCFREYHPELAVDTFPPNTLVNRYSSKYHEIEMKSRAAHAEMEHFVEDDIHYVKGTWYPNGIESNICETDVIFEVCYGNKEFTDDEIRELLSGNEISVDDYKSKSGLVCTIRGKLMRESNMYDGTEEFVFSRTDIDMTARSKVISHMDM